MAKTLAMIVGVVFLLVGLLGFVSNPIVGETGIFMTNMAHDLVHILVGVIMLVMASKGLGSKAMTIFGVVYLLLFVLGLLMETPMLGTVEFNSNDNWLHLVLGVALLALGMATKDSSTPSGMGGGMPGGMQ